MAPSDRKTGLEFSGDEVANAFPQLRLPGKEVTDRGVVRLGNGFITAGFPELRLPGQEIADSGMVRLGNGFITAKFPTNSAR